MNEFQHRIAEEKRVLTVIKAPRHFVKVGCQMLCRHAMPRSHNAALEQAKSRLHRVRVNVSIYVHAVLVADRFVFIGGHVCLLNCVGVGGEFVRYDNIDIATDVLFDVLCQRASFRIGGVEEAEIDACGHVRQDDASEGHPSEPAHPLRGLTRDRREPGRPERVEEILRACQELGRQSTAAIGISQLHSAGVEAARAYREALDAATIGRALLHDGGAIGYLVHIAADAAPRDRMREAVDVLIAYDKRRRSSLLDTLERYLAERRSVIESARALFIHPNTLRQRLARIEELTGVSLDEDDLLSLELAIKLARLHGRPGAPPVAASDASPAS